MKRFVRGLAKSLVTTIIVFGIAEGALRGAYAIRNRMVRFVPLPYALGDEYGPVPPWLDRLMILVPDSTTIWRSLPNVHRTYVDIFSPVRRPENRIELLRRFRPTIPAEFESNPTWTIDLNSRGYRGDEPVASNAPGTMRVACIGDSWTFGMNVNQDRTYPSRLAEHLRSAQPGRRIEVLNFGVLGYSSLQGLQVLKTRVLALHPDVVAIGFGMNDSGTPGYRDKDLLAETPDARTAKMRDMAESVELYKLLKYVSLRLKFRPRPISDYINEEAASKAAPPVDYSTTEAWTRVSPVDYEANIREMIALARNAGASVVLLDNELWDESPYRPILERISTDAHVPLVDSLALIGNAKRQAEREIEARLNLAPPDPRAPSDPPAQTAPPAPGRTSIVFRVFRGAYQVLSALSITGNAPELGSLTPNTVLMHDDGAEGDQRRGDGVWSYRASLTPGARVFYVYSNSGAPGVWEGLDVPHIREVVVPPSTGPADTFLPIDTFGRVYMQADNWHTDAVGYDLIARAVANAIGSFNR